MGNFKTALEWLALIGYIQLVVVTHVHSGFLDWSFLIEVDL